MHSISFIKQNEFELWNELWQKYLKFYQTSLPDTVTKVTWERIMDPEQNIFSFGGYWAADGTKELVGFTNFLYHSSTWSEQGYCYLEDLYVEEKFRGKGVGKILIEAVWDDCLRKGVKRLYWKTQDKNKIARIMYDKVAKQSGFIEYEIEV